MADEQRRRNLGRGLDALLGESRAQGSSVAANGASGGSGAGVTNLPIGDVYPGRTQPRQHFAQTEIDELAESIQSLGILQPLIVRPHPNRPGAYEIIAGERRWRAAQQVRLHEVPALVRELNDGEALEIALVENLQRENLSAVEEAEGYRRLMDEYSHTQEMLARMLGKSRSHIANTLRLLQLPDDVRAMLNDGRITAGHARALLASDNPRELATAIVKRGLSVRQAERQARGARDAAPRRARGVAQEQHYKDSNTKALESEIASAIGMRVAIDFDDPGGRLTINYNSLEQLDYVVHRLTLGELGRRYPRPESPRKTPSSVELPKSVDEAIRQMDEGATWDETEPFEFDTGSLDDDLEKLISEEIDEPPFKK
jgi:ParB family transcriptional regulator, chromosome partitioning protein